MKKFLVYIPFFIFLCALTVFSQDTADSAGQKSFFEIYILGGGVVGFIIIILSFIMVSLIIEHIFTLQRDKLVSPEAIVQLEELIENGQYDEAINLCEGVRNFVTNVVGAALLKTNEGEEAMVSAAESQVVEENTKLMHKISWLNLIGNIAPMLGLFGTVAGMVSAFSEIANSAEQPSPKDLAAGIYMALITTIWGLIVAIPAISAYFVFKNKVQKIGLELSAVSGELIERCKPAPKQAVRT